MMSKLPPKEKIVEAWSAVGAGRVAMGEGKAAVRSSNGEKEYTVTWKEGVYTSNDNATYWQGYAGYPVIAVLMLQGKLPYDGRMAALFAGVDWTALNKKHKGDYSAAVGEALEALGHAADSPRILREVDRIHGLLSELDITVKRGGLRPPKAG